ncbi:hypothetical protein LJ656_29760 [Paraburkholderia sp. MMS20-SJTR3]|uniref:Uncharacterized protein n=1 Tax=Paraburkholderia sejongensis TaxID=2886946 RepID=A0ABS8K3P8_9BURK|nr:hypothetical protein [Paraburkholderia sp. MMS20-SJTR3]MCC8396784.1 hypothetical protein [Paraburkholderia sp. MMS20-SJTR3]
MAIATSFSDCPDRTVYWLPAAIAITTVVVTDVTDAASGALAACAGAASALPAPPPNSAKVKATPALSAVGRFAIRP